ncbi:MAG: hypothetical protein MUP15_04085 [Dehalococcoidia bacterium]|nr:hypothetical protein [Dehalococcoidia bacterium]
MAQSRRAKRRASVRPLDASNQNDNAHLSWSAHPAREQPGRTLVALALIGFVGWLAYEGGGTWAWAAVAVACLLGATASYFCPSRYRLTAEDVEITGWLPRTRRPLSDFRGYDRHGDQVRLCTFTSAHRLDRFRALRMYLPDDAEAVLQFLEAHGIPRRQ